MMQTTNPPNDRRASTASSAGRATGRSDLVVGISSRELSRGGSELLASIPHADRFRLRARVLSACLLHAGSAEILDGRRLGIRPAGEVQWWARKRDEFVLD